MVFCFVSCDPPLGNTEYLPFTVPSMFAKITRDENDAETVTAMFLISLQRWICVIIEFKPMIFPICHIYREI